MGKWIKNRNFIKKEDGFSTLSIVVSLLLTLSLVFSTAQIYRINSASADIQSVADASCLAAENQVSEFLILVRVCDAVVLSLSLSSVASLALGVVCLCTPVTAEMSSMFLDITKRMISARNNFANKSSEILNKIQNSLAFISTAKAYQVALENNGGVMNADYMSIAIMMPTKGIKIEPGNLNEVENVLNDVNNNADDIRQAAKEAEEAAKKANEAKLNAFMADCGNNPNYCMYERAKTKAYLSGSENPLYNSPDTWNFSVALNRSKAYYPKRLQIDKPEGSSVNQQANSNLRKIFYKFAQDQLRTAYVNEYDDFFDAYFPHLPKNTDEMKQTSMYTDVLFPISNGNCMHAYSSCPGCTNVTSYGSIFQMENFSFEKCEYCKFSASSLGSVAAASSSIDNGYEYHYSIVEKSAADYKEAMKNAAPLNKKVKDYASRIFTAIKDLISAIGSKRIYAKPPGSYGCINITVNKSVAPASRGFESSFVTNNCELGIRAAISACTIIEEDSDESATMISSLLSGIKNDNLPGIGAAGIALDAWSQILETYSKGQEAFLDGIQNSLNQIPLFSASGLGTWAANQLRNILKDAGLEPANIKSLKPVLINSYYVANASANKNEEINDDKIGRTFAAKFLTIKKSALSISDINDKLLMAMSDEHELANLLNIEDLVYADGSVEIAVIEPIGDIGPSFPITIKLPKFAKDKVSEILSIVAGLMQSAGENIYGGKVWR